MARVGSQSCGCLAMNETSLIHGTIHDVWVSSRPIHFAIAVGRRARPFRTFEEIFANALRGLAKVEFFTAGVGTLQHMGALICWMIGGGFGRGYSHGRSRAGGESDRQRVTGNADFWFNPLPAVLGQLKAEQKCARILVPQADPGFPVVPGVRRHNEAGLSALRAG